MNAANQVTVRKLTSSVGAVIDGIDMRASMPDASVAIAANAQRAARRSMDVLFISNS